MPDISRPVHSVCISDRTHMTVTGVEDVDCFSETMAVIATSMGAITVTGGSLRVARLDLQAGEVELEGQVDVIEYGAAKKSGLLGKLFR